MDWCAFALPCKLPEENHRPMQLLAQAPLHGQGHAFSSHSSGLEAQKLFGYDDPKLQMTVMPPVSRKSIVAREHGPAHKTASEHKSALS